MFECLKFYNGVVGNINLFYKGDYFERGFVGDWNDFDVSGDLCGISNKACLENRTRKQFFLISSLSLPSNPRISGSLGQWITLGRVEG